MANDKEPEFTRCSIEAFCSMKGMSKTELGKKLGFTKQKIDYLINHKVGNVVEHSARSNNIRLIRCEEIVGECTL